MNDSRHSNSKCNGGSGGIVLLVTEGWATNTMGCLAFFMISSNLSDLFLRSLGKFHRIQNTSSYATRGKECSQPKTVMGFAYVPAHKR